MASYVSIRLQITNLSNCIIIVSKIGVLLQFVSRAEMLKLSVLQLPRKEENRLWPAHPFIDSLILSFIHSLIHSFYNLFCYSSIASSEASSP